MVAEADGAVAGYAIATRGWLDGDIPLLGLDPIAVAPEYQGRGIGGALLTEIRERATLAGERAILLLGHTGYYRASATFRRFPPASCLLTRTGESTSWSWHLTSGPFRAADSATRCPSVCRLLA